MGVTNVLHKCCKCAAAVWQKCGNSVAKRQPWRPRKGLQDRCLAPASIYASASASLPGRIDPQLPSCSSPGTQESGGGLRASCALAFKNLARALQPSLPGG
eukprot:1432153-Alexandrium_andersonii.AAC.1